MTIAIILLISGFVLLISGANYLITGASHIAKRLGISELIIGLTIVALGTSSPELIINIQSALNNSPNLAIANTLGSNIANILLILGLSSIIYPITVHRNTRLYDIPFMIGVSIIFGLLVTTPFETTYTETLTQSNSLILVILGLIFFYYLYFTSESETQTQNTANKNVDQHWALSLLYIMLGLLALIYGGDLIVNNVKFIAQKLQISERVIGLTLLAVGTSLPELATSVIAGLKGKSDLAIGNIVGSNILNIVFVLGITGILHPLPFHQSNKIDLLVVISSGFLLLVSVYIRPKEEITRYKGIIMLIVYILYILYVIG